MCDCVGNYVISYANVTSICLASTVTNCVCYCHFFFFFFCVGVIEIKFGIFPLLPMLTLFLFLAVALTLRSCVFFKLFYCINLQSYKLYTHRFFLFFGIIKLADIRNLYRSFSFFPHCENYISQATHIYTLKNIQLLSRHIYSQWKYLNLNWTKSKKSVWKFELLPPIEPTNQHSMEEKRASSMQKSEHTEWEMEIESEIGNHADPSKRSHGRLLFYANHSWLNWFILFVWVTFVYIFKSILIFNSCIANSSLLFTFFPFFIYTK